MRARALHPGGKTPRKKLTSHGSFRRRLSNIQVWALKRRASSTHPNLPAPHKQGDVRNHHRQLWPGSFPESTDHNSVRLTRPVARNLCSGAGASRKRSSRVSYPVGRAAFILNQKGDTLYEENPTLDFGSLRCPVVDLNALLEFLDAGGLSPGPGEKGPRRSQQSREGKFRHPRQRV